MRVIKTAPHKEAKEETMDTNHGGAESLSPLHRELGMTPAQVRAELVARGVDPDAEIEAMRRLGRVMAAKYAGQARQEEAASAPTGKRFRMFDESVSAGAPAYAGPADDAATATIMEVLRQADSSSALWVRVSGTSMRDVGIQDGDMVLIDTKREAKDKDIVVAHIAGEGQVLKRIRIGEGSPVVLESANPDFAPRVIDDPAVLRIHGVVVGRAGAV